MDRKMSTRSKSNSTSSSGSPSRPRPRHIRASTSTTASSSTSSSSSSSSVSSSSDSETSTSQGSSVKSVTMGSTDSDVAKPPNKKARVLNGDLGPDQQSTTRASKQPGVPPNRGNPISDKLVGLPRPVTKDIRTSSRRPRASMATITKENSVLATQHTTESNGPHPRSKPLGSVSNIDKPGKKSVSSIYFSEAESLSDYEKGKGNAIDGSTKKQTRSYSDIKSKYLTYSEESETDTKHVIRNSSKVKPNSSEDKYRPNSEVLIKEQRCPLRDCDSLGHLGGHLAKHFTKEACPMYHNQTVQECEAAYLKRQKNKEMMEVATKGEVQQTSIDNKDGKKKEMRIVLQDYRNMEQRNIPESDEAMRVNREPKLVGIAPEHDVHLFREAQAIASENVEQDQNLPYAMGTRVIEMGKYNLQVWYQSPYPEEFAHAPKLYICEYCLHYMKSSTTNRRHTQKCVWRHPPGEEIYRCQKTSIWEVDGKKHREYCQNLCLFAKFFLDHKTLHDNVEPFFFYVMTIVDSYGCHAVGYFSKEKNSTMNYNVSCILTFPHYQRQGYGRLLIEFSYLLTRTEGKIGTPEKPLSDLGLISYRSYWKDVLLNYLHTFTGKELSIKDMSQETGINSNDIVSTLQALSMIKYWKGKHIILKKQDIIDDYVERFKKHDSKHIHIESSLLKWVPKASG